MKSLKENKLILCILGLAFGLRVWGIWWGLPLYPHLDEQTIISPAIKIIQTGDLNPHYFRYPTLYIYFVSLIAFFYQTVVGEVSFETNREGLYLVSRMFTAIISTATIYLTYLLGKSLFSKQVGYFASLFLSIVFLPVYLSHFVTVDMLALLFLILALVYFQKIIRNGQVKDYLLGGFFSGMLVGTKFNIVILIPLVLSHILSVRRAVKKAKFICLPLALLMAVIAFLLTNPYFVLSFEEYVKGGISQVLLLSGQEVISMSDQDGIPSWLWYLDFWLTSGIGLPLSLTVIMGIYLYLTTDEKRDNIEFFLPFISFSIIYALILFLSHHRVDRYSLPLMPFFAIFSGLFLASILKLIKERVQSMPLMATFIFFSFLFFGGIPLYKVVVFDFIISQQDTRLRAGEWLEKKYTKGQMIFTVGDTIHTGHYLQSRGFDNVSNLFPLEDQEIFLYPGEILLIDSTNYQIASNYKKVGRNEQFWENYQLIRKEGVLISEFSQPLFKNGFFSPPILEHASTVNAYHHPTVEVYIIPQIGEVYKQEIRYEFLPEKMDSNMPLIKKDGLRYLYADGQKEVGTAGPYKIFPAGDYLLEYILFGVSCKGLGTSIDLRVISGGGARTFAEKKFSCRQALNNSKLTLEFKMGKASSLELALRSKEGSSFNIEKAVLSRTKVPEWLDMDSGNLQ